MFKRILDQENPSQYKYLESTRLMYYCGFLKSFSYILDKS